MLNYAAFFITTMFLCLLFPYMGDDWAWGSQIGLDRLASWFEGYNGRYVGNLIVLVLTRSNLIKSIVMAFFLTGLLSCVHRIAKGDYTRLLCILCLVFLPIGISREAIVWTSGFSNYVVSACTTLIYIQYIYWVFDSRKSVDPKNLRQHPFHGILLAALGIVNTLIVEHITVYNLILALFVIGYVLYRFRKVLVQQVCYLAGTVAGTIYMFSNSAYARVMAGEDYYRAVESSIRGLFYSAWSNYLSEIVPNLYKNNLFINGVMLILCIFVYCSLAREGKHSACCLRVLRLELKIQMTYFAYSAFSVLYLGTASKQMGLLILEGIFTLISGIFLIYFLTVIALHYKILERIAFLAGSILFISATLLIVMPIGPRCFFITYVLFILLLLEVWNLPPIQTVVAARGKTLEKACRTLIVIALLFYFTVFSAIFQTDRERVAYARRMADAGEKVIEIQKLPYEGFLFNSVPAEGTQLAVRFKLFYGLPEDVFLVTVNEYGEPITPLP